VINSRSCHHCEEQLHGAIEEHGCHGSGKTGASKDVGRAEDGVDTCKLLEHEDHQLRA
jgi:hypothetical protein